MDINPKEDYEFESLLKEDNKVDEIITALKYSSNLLTIILIALTMTFVLIVTSGLFRLSLITVYLITVFGVLKFVEKSIRSRVLLGLSSITLVFLILLYNFLSIGTLYLVDAGEMESGMRVQIQNLGIQEEKLPKLIKRSSNVDVIAFEGNEIIAKSPGESTLTFSDIFGNSSEVKYKVIETDTFSFNVTYDSDIAVSEEKWIVVYPIPYSLKTLNYKVDIIEGSEFGEIVDVEANEFNNGSQKVKALKGLKKGTMRLRVSTEKYGFKDFIVKVSNGTGNFLISPMLDKPIPSLDSTETIFLDSPESVLIQPLTTNAIYKEDLACSVNGTRVNSFDQNGFFEVFVEGKVEIICTHDNKISNMLTFDIGGELYAR